MDSQALWIGFDMGRTQTHMCVLDHLGETVHEEVCNTDVTTLSAALATFPRDRISMIAVEAGGETHTIRKLRAAGYPITMFEARKAQKFLAVRPSKTDKSDARGLADLGRVGRSTVSNVHLKSLECEQLRSKIATRQRIVKLRVTTENVVRSRLEFYGLKYVQTRALGGVKAQAETLLKQLRAADGIDLRAELAPLLDVCETLRKCLMGIDRELAKFAKSNAVCRLLMEVPGVGQLCAISFYTAIDDPARFERASDVAPYLGLGPKRYQSGEVSLTLGITKIGSKMTRTHLVTAAGVFGTVAPDCALKQWYLALKGRAGSKRARVALARKLSIVLLTMWKNGSHFEARRHPAEKPAENSSLPHPSKAVLAEV